MNIISKNRDIILYGVALALILMLLKYIEFSFLFIHHSVEMFSFFIAIIFTCLGIWLSQKLRKPYVKTITIEKEIKVMQEDFIFNEEENKRLGISKRELEVLQLMADGKSNDEIANALFLSLPTIKTHVSRLFLKLEVKRRTQAVEIARKKQLLP